MKWPKDFISHIIQENCLKIMKGIPDESIDLVLTDPPYGIGFMGKEWDSFKIRKITKSQVINWMNTTMTKDIKGMSEFFTPIWRECLRVLKPGAFTFVMCSPRQDVLCKQILALKEAGFVMGFTSIYWAYASGFPKAMNIGKAVDKRLNYKRKVVGRYKHPRSIEKGKTIDNSWGRGSLDNTLEGYITQGDDKRTLAERLNITAPGSSQAKTLDGSYGGFQPKPAVEVILVCMKPLTEKTYVGQALKNAKGITWLDSARIPYKNEDKPKGGFGGMGIGIGKPTKHQRYSGSQQAHSQGRFPANLLVSDDVLNDGRMISYGKRAKPYSYQNKRYNVEGFIKDNSPQAPSNYADSGSFSRYFDLDKWFENRIKDLPESVQKTFPFLIVPKASKKEKNKGLEQLDDKILARSGGAQQAIKKGHQEYLQNHIGFNRISKVKNIHPTCKPIRLMSYLITLGSRKGDLILDPFVGSGTTCISAKISNRRFIGIEKERDYVEIAKARLTGVVKERQGEFWEQF